MEELDQDLLFEQNEILYSYHKEQGNLLTIDEAATYLDITHSEFKNNIKNNNLTMVYGNENGKLKCFLLKTELDSFILEKRVINTSKSDFARTISKSHRKSFKKSVRKSTILFIQKDLQEALQLRDSKVIKSVSLMVREETLRFIKEIEENPDVLVELKKKIKSGIQNKPRYINIKQKWNIHLESNIYGIVETFGILNKNSFFRHMMRRALNRLNKNKDFSKFVRK